MNRREFLRVVGAGTAAVLLGEVRGQATKARRRPNVVLILADDLGYADLGCYGADHKGTPHIDSIAANGVRFTQGYVSCPVCSPTRAGLLTGRYQQRFGHEHNPGGAGPANFGLPEKEKTLADVLKEAGYVTGLVGKWHLGERDGCRPNQRGFDSFFGFLGGAHSYLKLEQGIGRDGQPAEEKAYLTEAFGREAVKFIERAKDRPFFLYLAFNAVHAPMEEPPAKYMERFANVEDAKRRTFLGMLAAMDDAVGEVLKKLRDAKLEEDTIVFFLSDNGGPTNVNTSRNDPLRGTKTTVYEGGIRVPFLAQWKGQWPAGVVDERPVISLDVFPTAATAAKAKAPDDRPIDGVDLNPYFEKNKSRPHETLCWRFNGQAAVRKGNWKLLRPANGEWQLYDLVKDVGETTDLAAERPEVVKELQAAYEGWEKQMIPALWGQNRPATRPRGGRRARP